MLKCHPHGLGFLQRGQMLCVFILVCNVCLPPSLNFTKKLDEKQKIKLLWPKGRGAFKPKIISSFVHCIHPLHPRLLAYSV